MFIHNRKRSETDISQEAFNFIIFNFSYRKLCRQGKKFSNRGSKISASPNSVPSTRQLLAGSFHESLRITEIAVKALLLTSGILLYCSAKLTLKFGSMDRNFNVRGEINPAPSSFNNKSSSSASVNTFNSSSNPALCQIY